MVFPKKNGKWRGFVDYYNLNDACLKDTFPPPPPPPPDQIVDVTSGHKLLSFLDAYSSYNQILMYPPYSANTTFITSTRVYCYSVMPFSLKNVRATYQDMMSRIFEPLLGRTIEAYIDDMLVKSKTWEDHIAHFPYAFQLMRLHCLRLNPNKCALGSGMGISL